MTYQTGDTYNCSLGTYFVDDIVEYYVIAFDNSTSLNPTITSTYSFEILNQPPTEPTLLNPGTIIEDSIFFVNWTAGTDLENAIDHYELQMSNSSGFSVILNQWSVSALAHEVTVLTDGTYYFRVKTVDDHGALSSWSNIESIIIDLSGPTMTGIGHTPASPLHGDSVTISVNVTDPSAIKNVTCWYRVNSGTWIPVLMAQTVGDRFEVNIGSFLVDDVVEYDIHAFDNSTNHYETISSPVSFTILNQAPLAPILIDPGTIISSDHFLLNWTAAYDLEGAIDHYEVQMSATNDFTLILGEWNVTLTDREFSGLSNGVYYFRVRTVDDHGAVSDWSNIESIELQSSTTSTSTTTTIVTDTTTTTTTNGGPFDADILSLVFLIITVGSMAIIVIIVVAIIRQRSAARRQYNF